MDKLSTVIMREFNLELHLWLSELKFWEVSCESVLLQSLQHLFQVFVVFDHGFLVRLTFVKDKYII